MGCKSLCAIKEVAYDHVRVHNNSIIFQTKDIMLHTFVGVYYLRKVSKVLCSFHNTIKEDFIENVAESKDMAET